MARWGQASSPVPGLEGRLVDLPPGPDCLDRLEGPLEDLPLAPAPVGHLMVGAPVDRPEVLVLEPVRV